MLQVSSNAPYRVEKFKYPGVVFMSDRQKV